MLTGFTLAILGGSIAAFLAGLGSALGCAIAGRAAAGVTTEDPSKFARLLLLQALPGTQGFYGLVGMFLILNKLGMVSDITTITTPQGWQILFAAIPVGIVGLISAVAQGQVCAAGCSVVAKKPEEVGKALVYGVIVETYGVLGFLATFLLLGSIKLG
ncbi:MAG: V-type ATP synthase subunit K [Elusimicrobiota bacterium]